MVFTSYANPALAGSGAPCPGGPAGFDVHPSFNANPQRLASVAGYVDNEFLPQLKALALCQRGIICRDPRADRMTFVDAHQQTFAGHGFCARSQTDPEFDRECFSPKGESFNTDLVTAANQPMLCGRSASEYRAYSAARALDPRRQRQLFFRDDLSAGPAGQHAAVRHP